MPLVLAGATSGSTTLQATDAVTQTITLPNNTGTIITTGSSGQSIPKAALPAGSVLQVVSSTKTDTFSTTASSFTDVTGLSVSITPTSATSKIFVILSIAGVNADTTGSTARIARNGTGIGVATSAGSRNAGGTGEMYSTVAGSVFLTYVSTVLDSPATTSAITYSGQIIAGSGGSYTTYINRSATDSNTNAYTRGASSITVMEIAA